MDKLSLFVKKIHLKNKQRVVDKQFENEGLTDDVLAKQVEINSMRHELDIHDSNNVVYEDYVQ